MSKLGIIAGAGKLPLTIANNFKLMGIGELFIAVLDGYGSYQDYLEFNHEIFKIGKVGKILGYFKKNNVKDLVIVGSVKRFDLNNLAVDIQGSALLTKILANKFLGDNKLLTIVADFIESKGFTIKSPLDYIKNDMTKMKISPNKKNLSDIEYGKIVARKLGELDIGQSVIVENGMVIGVEAAEGTDELIKRCSLYLKSERKAVLVKMTKPNQDKRLDIPVIGINTIENVEKAKMAGIAIERNSVIILDPENLVNEANKLGIFLYLFD